ncbi:hypothetical protein POM88_016083 [Heracleum sosnowskyi]|uniref:Uncharacterized protein n=1 Tax=Heracleum sosnowskyi TaxID=360622 RepID=A0AAD8ILG5_9APIA|nr:hypothetical protein POM88_016083 [Heracleum sosnowskyi]
MRDYSSMLGGSERWNTGSRKKDPQLKCNFFEWAEPQYTERAREVIEDLKLKLSYKCDEILSLSDDLSIADKENMLLKEQLSVAERKNKETMEVLSKETELGKRKKLSNLFAMACFVIWFLYICN